LFSTTTTTKPKYECHHLFLLCPLFFAAFALTLVFLVTASHIDNRAVPVYPQPGQTKGPGVLPPKVSKLNYRGPLQYKTTSCVRDLGFSGVVNNQIVWTFGDTVGLLPNGKPEFGISATDSAGLGDINNPLNVHDYALDSNGWPTEWIPFNSLEKEGLSRWAEGGTNVIEYAPNKGLVWYLKNDRKSGRDNIIGAGVATVTVDASGPKATRPFDTMWSNSEPFWGDIGVTYNHLDQNAYIFGHGPAISGLESNVYLSKVPAKNALDIKSYQYWDQSTKSWTNKRFGNGTDGTLNVTSAQAIFIPREVGQSNAFWSNYYNTWMFVYGADVGYTDVMVKTADKLEGPWTKGFTIASTCPNNTCSAIRYCIAPHPEFDPTGKTLLVTWTDSNNVLTVEITWD